VPLKIAINASLLAIFSLVSQMNCRILATLAETKHWRAKAMNEEVRTKVKQSIEREFSPKLSTENALKDKV
jgi:hypothetical protein